MWSLTLLGLLPFLAGFVYLVAPYLYIKCLRHRQARQVATHRCIVLTFDDGPGLRLTPAILALLAEYNARATFFMLGRNVRGREHLVKAVADGGHEIGTHSYDHLHSWKVFPTRAIADIRRGEKEIQRVLKTKQVLLFRPPYGKVNLFTLLYLLCRRIPICTWTLDTRDTWRAPERDGDAIDAAIRQSEGVISLAHDFDRHDSSIDDYVLMTLRATLDYAREAGIQFSTMREALEM